MGSYALSTSNTSYTNTPLTLQDNRNGVALAGNRDTLLGGSGNVAGSSNVGNSTNSGNLSLGAGSSYNFNALDGGAIQGAFDYGKSLLQITADTFQGLFNAQQHNNDVASAIASTPTAAIQNSAPSNQPSAQAKPNYTLLAVALAAAFFAYKAFK